GDDGSLAAEVQEHLDDLELLTRIETIRDRHAETEVRHRDVESRRLPPDDAEVEGRRSDFGSWRGATAHAPAFAGWGLSPERTTAKEAVRRLEGRPDAIRNGLLAALYDWYWVAADHHRPEAEWLGQVISLADDDSWRREVRVAAKRTDLPTLK